LRRLQICVAGGSPENKIVLVQKSTVGSSVAHNVGMGSFASCCDDATMGFFSLYLRG